jgi:hypothetical protein
MLLSWWDVRIGSFNWAGRGFESAMRECRAFAVVMAITVVEAFAGLSLNAQDAVRSVTSLSLRLSGPSFVRAGDLPHFQAFLVNNSKNDVEVPASFFTEGAMYLNWRVVGVSQHHTYSSPATETFCNFGKYSSPRGFSVLRPGQRLELLDIKAPKELLRSDGKGRYRISLRFSPPSVLISPENTLQEKPLYGNLTSNEMTVDFTAYRVHR